MVCIRDGMIYQYIVLLQYAKVMQVLIPLYQYIVHCNNKVY